MAASSLLSFILCLSLQELGPDLMHALPIIYHFWTYYRVLYLPNKKAIPHAHPSFLFASSPLIINGLSKSFDIDAFWLFLGNSWHMETFFV